MRCEHDIDAQLIAAIKRNDPISYNKLFIRYYVRLCKYVYSILLNKDDAEDIIQELFLYIWDNRKKIDIQENVSGYLYKMSKNLTLNHIRKNATYRVALEKQKKLSPEYIEENTFESNEFRSVLYGCIDRLPNRSKEVLLLHRVKGLRQKEIADKLNISVKTIKNLIWISLQKLRSCLEIRGMTTF